MPENLQQGPRPSNRVIEGLAARAALQTPGVLRLEPTIFDLMARIRPLGVPAQDEPGTPRHEGVTATATVIDGIATVHLDIATDITHTALEVADTVQQRVRDGIEDTGLLPGSVNISILAIEPASNTV